MSINFVRRQLPLKLAYAMTINKAQGQSFTRVGVRLNSGIFSHGQLYVALSRVGAAAALKVSPTAQFTWQNRTVLTAPDAQEVPTSTTNVVYHDIL